MQIIAVVIIIKQRQKNFNLDVKTGHPQVYVKTIKKKLLC